MGSLREKVTGGPLGKKAPMKIIVGTPSTEKPIGPEGKTLTPPQHPPPDDHAAYYAELRAKNKQQLSNRAADLARRGLKVK